jgi:formate hydrogenlyase subunit 3/multisubunit Na+/H+ antiporter MnhD subunit
MKQKLWIFIRDSLLYAGVFLFATVIICWLANWRTLENFSTGFFIAGVVALVFGTARVLGLGMLRSGMYQYGQSVGTDSMNETIRKDTYRVYIDTPSLLKMVVVAVICFILSWLVGLVR